METVKITINGIVQGVGFRPFIAKLAKKLGIFGSVRNSSGTVIILAQERTKDGISTFLKSIEHESPAGSFISNISAAIEDAPEFDCFTIIESEENTSDEIVLPADMPVCETCISELFDKNDRRYRYPFISCVSCGARYSIIKAVPYDRERTSMDSFDMCPECLNEYEHEHEHDSRRCYAQTISCHDCGPQLMLRLMRGNSEVNSQGEEALQKAIDILKHDGILAMKSIGGYNYICKTTSPKAVENLRLLKSRENKPFAIMFSNINEVKKCCHVSDEEEKLLLSVERPIVLLEQKEKVFDYNICRGSRYIGAFLPYTPLHYLLLSEFENLIITSANISDLPIIFKDDDMLEIKSEYLSGVLYNTREIITPLDDSVSRVVLSSPQLIRRSRGYVPLPMNINIENTNSILAAGGDLKSCFCLLKNKKAYMSQYFGDLESFEIYQLFEKTYRHMTKLFNIKPTIAVVDKHPSYISRNFGEGLGLKLVELQHHAAHIYSVMAENSLDSAIGVAFDGTGYGDDGCVWGGEFFTVNGCNYTRAAHLDYVKLCGGDMAAKDAGLLKTCYLYAMGCKSTIEDKRFTTIKASLDNNINTQLSSSMGRLFDAVSSILNIKSYNSYEGECAILLENCAYEALKSNEEPYKLSFDLIKRDSSIIIGFFKLIEDIMKAQINDEKISRLALGFHYAVAEMIASVCKLIRTDTNINTVALSGGVFANKILLERTALLLERYDFACCINKAVPTNDSGIALGQVFYAAKYLSDE